MRKRRDFLSASAAMMDLRHHVELRSESICGLTSTKYFMQNVKHARCHKQAVFWNAVEPELKNDFNQNCKSPFGAAFIYVDWIEWRVIIPGLPRFPLFISHFLSILSFFNSAMCGIPSEKRGPRRMPAHTFVLKHTLCDFKFCRNLIFNDSGILHERKFSSLSLQSSSFSFKVHLISINLANVV